MDTLNQTRSMILTFYYTSSTWIHWWRLYSSCKILKRLLNEKTTVVLYEQKVYLKNVKIGEAVSTKNVRLKGITSKYCLNASDARILDVIETFGNKRKCSIVPLQQVNISNWISFPHDTTIFPIRVKQNNRIRLNSATQMNVLIEANFRLFPVGSINYACQIDQFGVPKAWTAGAYFAFIIETDVEHFNKLCEHFLRSVVSIDEILEVIRLETVDVNGNPYNLVNQDKVPITTCPINTVGDNLYGARNEESDDSGVYEYTSKPDKLLFRHIAETPLRPTAASPGWLPIFDDVFLEKREIISYPAVGADSSVLQESLDVTDDSSSILSQSAVEGRNNVCNNSKYAPSRSCSEDTSTSLIVQQGSTICSSNASQFSTDTVIQEPLFDLSGMNSVDEEIPCDVTMWKSDSSASLLSSKSITLEKSKPIKPVSHRGDEKTGKPSSVLIYSESPSSVENMKITLSFVLHQYRYTIYTLTLNEMLESPWLDQAALVVICGNVPTPLKPILISYLLGNRGKLLCVCSDLLESFLPSFKTTEIKPDEVVNFSYSKWDNISLLHHIFCYQPTPQSSKFSMDESPSGNVPPTNIPATVDIEDEDKVPHQLQVKVLAAEKTWQTPTLLLANETESNAKVLFSQVHLELDPDKKEEVKGKNLRLELLADLLSEYLDMHCCLEQTKLSYVPAYFLGRHETKLEFLEKLNAETKQENILKAKNITLQFCGKGVTPPEASAHLLPVLIHDCPATFSTVEYFENLNTEHIGRLVIYADVITSTMQVFSGPILEHGLVAIPRQMTSGVGRGKNSWISPEGCAMFTVQIHIPSKSVLGQRLSLMQHIISLSVVTALCEQPGYENLNLGLKWPNDIYAGGNVKVGGIMVISHLSSEKAICNVGVGVNLDNSLPTTCINDLIVDMNSNTGSTMPKISLEKFFAWVFNQMEKILDSVQSGGLEQVIDLYYKYWLHSFADVQVLGKDGKSQRVTIIGLDEYGFLKVKNSAGDTFSVHPDGNSFNMLVGLIAPK